MSLVQRFERRLEGLVGGAFARVFKGQVEPVEIGTALQREAADHKSVMGNGEVLCPNRYRVTLSPSDHERLVPWEVQLTNSLAELVQEYLDENRWSTVGDVEVYLARDEQLHTGVFGVASRMEPGAPPRRRPHDSLSLPAVQLRQPDGGDQHAAPQQPGSAPQPYAPRGYAQQPQYAQQPRYASPPYAPPPQVAPHGQRHPPQGQQRDPQPPDGRPPRRPMAVLVVDETSERFALRPGSNVIGRGSEADLQLMDQGVSRRHVDVQYDGMRATIYDLGSTNGTNVNGHEIGSHVLRHGDVVRIGHSRIVFHEEQP